MVECSTQSHAAVTDEWHVKLPSSETFRFSFSLYPRVALQQRVSMRSQCPYHGHTSVGHTCTTCTVCKQTSRQALSVCQQKKNSVF
jgi:hypothetical protein